MNDKATNFLLADDDRDDQEMFKDVLLEMFPQSILHIVANGRAVVDFLHHCTDLDMPNLIVLDYNMPKGNGPDVLDVLNSYVRYRVIPKIVWSTSGSEDFIDLCIIKGAKAFFIKPDNFAGLKKVIGEITSFAVIPPS
jgi:CheY-like chemotaxis protein